MKPNRLSLPVLALCALPFVAGCSRLGAANVRARAAHPTSLPLTAAQLAQYRPNEMGVVPILEYHGIGPINNRMNRTAATFRADLERLYREGYRPIGLEDFLSNRIDVPLGKSPVILTFDDARGSQFRYLKDGTIDPDCAVGILQAFQKTHPDFPVKATFFLLPVNAFEQPKYVAQKMQALYAMGCELGNHTVTHRALRKLSDEEVQKELATCAAMIQKAVPQAHVDMIALPFGIGPRNRALLASGEYAGRRYANHAVLLVGAAPAPSPVSTRFDPMRLPRVLALKGTYGLTYWLDDLRKHPQRRYVSDGDPGTVTVPRALADRLDKGKLNGAHLRLY